jgi:hypothetical protein
VAKFANIWSKKLDLNKNVLQKYLFEDYSYNSKTKKLVKCGDTHVPMFAMMILDPIWQLYDTAVTQGLPEKASKMAFKGIAIFFTDVLSLWSSVSVVESITSR